MSDVSLLNPVGVGAAQFTLVLLCCFSEVMRAYLQQLRQETGLRLCDKVFDPQSDKPSKVRVQRHQHRVSERLGVFVQPPVERNGIMGEGDFSQACLNLQ